MLLMQAWKIRGSRSVPGENLMWLALIVATVVPWQPLF